MVLNNSVAMWWSRLASATTAQLPSRLLRTHAEANCLFHRGYYPAYTSIRRVLSVSCIKHSEKYFPISIVHPLWGLREIHKICFVTHFRCNRKTWNAKCIEYLNKQIKRFIINIRVKSIFMTYYWAWSRSLNICMWISIVSDGSKVKWSHVAASGTATRGALARAPDNARPSGPADAAVSPHIFKLLQ